MSDASDDNEPTTAKEEVLALKKSNEEELIERFHEGQDNSHKANDSKDQRSIANKLERETQREKEGNSEDTLEVQMLKEDPTLPARAHGNEPSRGAKIDKQIADEEAEIIAKMDAKKANK